MNERLRAKPIVIGALVTFFGGMICGIGVAVYSTGGDLAKMQTFEKDATIATRGGDTSRRAGGAGRRISDRAVGSA
jgi:hypothetical protein